MYVWVTPLVSGSLMAPLLLVVVFAAAAGQLSDAFHVHEIAVSQPCCVLRATILPTIPPAVAGNV